MRAVVLLLCVFAIDFAPSFTRASPSGVGLLSAPAAQPDARALVEAAHDEVALGGDDACDSSVDDDDDELRVPAVVSTDDVGCARPAVPLVADVPRDGHGSRLLRPPVA